MTIRFLFITRRRILQLSSGIDAPDGLVWELVLTLTIAWVLVYFSVWKGVKIAGKVSHLRQRLFTSTEDSSVHS